MKIKTHAEEKEARSGGLDESSQKHLKIKNDKDVLTEDERAIVKDIVEKHDLRDFTVTNNSYGPASGLSRGQRLIRAHGLGLLRLKPTS